MPSGAQICRSRVDSTAAAKWGSATPTTRPASRSCARNRVRRRCQSVPRSCTSRARNRCPAPTEPRVELVAVNVALLLEMVADGAPDRVVVGSRDGGLTAASLLQRARKAAALFTARDVAHVGFIDVNSDAVPVALFGAALAGIPFAPVNYRLTDTELRALTARLTPGVVIAGRDVVPRIESADGLHVMTTDDFVAAVASAAPASDESDLPFVDPDEIAVLLFTSGTTGEPKAAVLRHKHLVSYIIGSVEYLGAGDDDAQLVSVPPYHVAGVSAV